MKKISIMSDDGRTDADHAIRKDLVELAEEEEKFWGLIISVRLLSWFVRSMDGCLPRASKRGSHTSLSLSWSSTLVVPKHPHLPIVTERLMSLTHVHTMRICG